MLSVGVDTHLKTHTIEVQNDRRQSAWKGTVNSSREGFGRGVSTEDVFAWLSRVDQKMSEMSPERRRVVINQWLRRDTPMVNEED